jgi:two-component system LytT family response regulator
MNNLDATSIVPIEKTYFPLRILQNSPESTLWRKLAVNSGDEIRFIPFEEIIYCKSTSNYTTVYMLGGKSHVFSKTLKDIEAKLPADLFLRIHNSYVVNLDFITSLKKQTSELEVENRVLLPVSRTKKKALYQLLGL